MDHFATKRDPEIVSLWEDLGIESSLRWRCQRTVHTSTTRGCSYLKRDLIILFPPVKVQLVSFLAILPSEAGGSMTGAGLS